MRMIDCLSRAWSGLVDCLCGKEKAEASPPEAPPAPEPPKEAAPPAEPARADAKEEKAPETARSSGAPYREPAPEIPPPPPPPEPEWTELCVKGGDRIMCKVVRRGDVSLEDFQKVRSKVQRRALRHFAGKEVRHRVVRKDAQEIEMAFHRRSSKGPVKLLVRREPVEPNVAQVGSA